jgi:hypothetical protein
MLQRAVAGWVDGAGRGHAAAAAAMVAALALALALARAAVRRQAAGTLQRGGSSRGRGASRQPMQPAARSGAMQHVAGFDDAHHRSAKPSAARALRERVVFPHAAWRGQGVSTSVFRPFARRT